MCSFATGFAVPIPTFPATMQPSAGGAIAAYAVPIPTPPATCSLATGSVTPMPTFPPRIVITVVWFASARIPLSPEDPL